MGDNERQARINKLESELRELRLEQSINNAQDELSRRIEWQQALVRLQNQYPNKFGWGSMAQALRDANIEVEKGRVNLNTYKDNLRLLLQKRKDDELARLQSRKATP